MFYGINSKRVTALTLAITGITFVLVLAFLRTILRAEVGVIAASPNESTIELAAVAAQIAGVWSFTGTAVESIRKTKDRMGDIDAHTLAIADSVQQQNTAAAEISANTAGAAEGAELVATVLTEVAQAADKTREWSSLVLSASQAVAESAANLRNEVEGFLETVAA